jgi:hypothetical protein
MKNDIQTILKKVKKHHHNRAHRKGIRVSKHESIEWSVNPDQNITYPLQLPTIANTPAPIEWIQTHREKTAILRRVK